MNLNKTSQRMNLKRKEKADLLCVKIGIYENNNPRAEESLLLRCCLS